MMVSHSSVGIGQDDPAIVIVSVSESESQLLVAVTVTENIP
jgi:hypothetical protein